MCVCESVGEGDGDWYQGHRVGEGGPLSLVQSLSGLPGGAQPHPRPPLRTCLCPFWLLLPPSSLPVPIAPWLSALSLTASISVSVSDTPLVCSLDLCLPPPVCVLFLSGSASGFVSSWALGPLICGVRGAAQAQVFPWRHTEAYRGS